MSNYYGGERRGYQNVRGGRGRYQQGRESYWSNHDAHRGDHSRRPYGGDHYRPATQNWQDPHVRPSPFSSHATPQPSNGSAKHGQPVQDQPIKDQQNEIMDLEPTLSMNERILRRPNETHIKPGEFAFVPIKQEESYDDVQPKRRPRDDLKGVCFRVNTDWLKKPFSQMTWKEKVLSQWVCINQDAIQYDETVVPGNKLECPESNDGPVRRRKEAAAQMAFIQTRNEFLKADESEDEDSVDNVSSDGVSDDDSIYNPKKKQAELKGSCGHELWEVEQFIKALPQNYVFSNGFDILLVRSLDNKCWCPCGRHMAPWRTQLGLDCTVKPDICCKDAKAFEGKGLIAHLEIKGTDCPLHFGTLRFLHEYYGQQDDGAGHKFLYVNKAEYDRAEAAEHEEVFGLIREAQVARADAEERARKLQLEVDEARTQMKKNMEKANKDKFETQEKLRRLKELLGVQDVISKAAPLSIAELEKYDRYLEYNFDTLRNLCGEGSAFTFKVPQPFDITKVMQTHHADNTFLFAEVKNIQTLFARWDIQYLDFEVDRKNQKRYKKVKKIAEDEGGPSRAFFSSFWSNIGQLRTHHENIKLFKLFEECPRGYVPLTDEQIEHNARCEFALQKKIKLEPEEENVITEVIDNVKKMYKAVGIVLLRCIMTRHRLAASSIPPFYREVFLRNIEPRNVSEEDRSEMMQQLNDMGYMNYEKYEKLFDGLTYQEASDLCLDHFKAEDYDDASKVVDVKDFFWKMIQSQVVDSRRMAISAIVEGLTLGGKVAIQPFLGVLPKEYIEKRLFAMAITVDEVINCIEMHCDESNKCEDEDEKKRIEHFRNETLIPVLREMSQEKLTQFVSFCTGFDYIPDEYDGKPFKIIVELNRNENMDDNSIPMAHTCVFTLKLPWRVYGGDRDIFAEKLDMAIAYSDGVI